MLPSWKRRGRTVEQGRADGEVEESVLRLVVQGEGGQWASTPAIFANTPLHKKLNGRAITCRLHLEELEAREVRAVPSRCSRAYVVDVGMVDVGLALDRGGLMRVVLAKLEVKYKLSTLPVPFVRLVRHFEVHLRHRNARAKPDNRAIQSSKQHSSRVGNVHAARARAK